MEKFESFLASEIDFSGQSIKTKSGLSVHGVH